MRYIVVLVALLAIPIAADADVITDSRNIAVEVTISVAGTLSTGGEPLVIDDNFVLRGTGGAVIALTTEDDPGNPGVEQRQANFSASDGSISASGSVVELRRFDFPFLDLVRGGGLLLDTPLYNLEFAVQTSIDDQSQSSIFMGYPIGAVSFSAASHITQVTVGGEFVMFIGDASFSAIGFPIPAPAVPEPGAAILLGLGIAAMAVWRKRGE